MSPSLILPLRETSRALTIVTATFVLAALLISAILFLIVDMDTPSTGLIEVSRVPVQRTLAQLQR